MKKSFITLLVFLFALAAYGQIPTSGLVAYYPFDGDAKDHSGYSNDGTVNGPVLTSDRFGISNSAYSFDGQNDYIVVSASTSIQPTGSFTISAWALVNDFNVRNYILTKRINVSSPPYDSYAMHTTPASSAQSWQANASNASLTTGTTSISKNTWYHVVEVYDGSKIYLYVNNKLEGTANTTGSITYSSLPLYIGNAALVSGNLMNGKIDDIRIYNRELSTTEIKALYNEGADQVAIVTEPTNLKIAAGDSGSFSIVAAGTKMSYQWQIKNGPIFQNLSDDCIYTGTNTSRLHILSASSGMFNSIYRCIVSNPSSSITSKAVTLILDTPHVVIYDTVHVSVTDTLVIKAHLSGIAPPNNFTTIKIYPNPTSDHLLIDLTNTANMVGYSLRITNDLGQPVFQNAVDRGSFNLDMSTWTGKGLYFLYLKDNQGKILDIRKIVLK